MPFFLLLLCVSFSENCCQWVTTHSFHITFFTRCFFVCWYSRPGLMAENLDKQLKLYPTLRDQRNTELCKNPWNYPKNIFMGISHFVFLGSYLFYDLLCTSLQYLPHTPPSPWPTIYDHKRLRGNIRMYRGCTSRTGYFKCREVKTGFYRNKSMQTGSSGTLIG